MGTPALATNDSADAQTQTGVSAFDGTLIVTMNGETP